MHIVILGISTRGKQFGLRSETQSEEHNIHNCLGCARWYDLTLGRVKKKLHTDSRDSCHFTELSDDPSLKYIQSTDNDGWSIVCSDDFCLYSPISCTNLTESAFLRILDETWKALRSGSIDCDLVGSTTQLPLNPLSDDIIIVIFFLLAVIGSEALVILFYLNRKKSGTFWWEDQRRLAMKQLLWVLSTVRVVLCGLCILVLNILGCLRATYCLSVRQSTKCVCVGLGSVAVVVRSVVAAAAAAMNHLPNGG
jgi:hypothetical protein